jgi:hypothetical protein
MEAVCSSVTFVNLYLNYTVLQPEKIMLLIVLYSILKIST